MFSKLARLCAVAEETLAAVKRVERTVILEGKLIMSQLDDLISDINANTNAVAAKLDKLTAEIAAAGQAPTPAQLDQLAAISAHLKALGSDPAAPVPAAPAG